MERNRKIWMQILVLAAVLRFFPFDFQTAVSTASEDVAAAGLAVANAARYPAARLAELGRVPYSAKKFFVKHQDRILFGTDCTPLGMGYHKIYYRFFETKDEYFPYQPEGELPGQGRWAIYGIGLEDEILKKIYYKNACKVLSLDENRFVGGVR